MNTKEKLKEEIGESWYSLIEKDVESKDFIHYFASMFTSLSKYNEEKNYPKREEIFKMFKELEPEKVKVLILGQSPYPLPGYANGIAFAIPDEQMSVPYSLKIIKREIEESLYDGLYLDFDYSFRNVIKQGVFLLNACLTTKARVGEPSHLEFWRRFIELILKNLSKTNPNIVYILMGNSAKEFEYKIHYNNFIIKTVHPASELYHPQTFLGCGCFKQCNEYLNLTNNKEILW